MSFVCCVLRDTTYNGRISRPHVGNGEVPHVSTILHYFYSLSARQLHDRLTFGQGNITYASHNKVVAAPKRPRNNCPVVGGHLLLYVENNVKSQGEEDHHYRHQYTSRSDDVVADGVRIDQIGNNARGRDSRRHSSELLWWYFANVECVRH